METSERAEQARERATRMENGVPGILLSDNRNYARGTFVPIRWGIKMVLPLQA
jgi:hypothetical protein